MEISEFAYTMHRCLMNILDFGTYLSVLMSYFGILSACSYRYRNQVYAHERSYEDTGFWHTAISIKVVPRAKRKSRIRARKAAGNP
jgi:hypothetical protein